MLQETPDWLSYPASIFAIYTLCVEVENGTLQR